MTLLLIDKYRWDISTCAYEPDINTCASKRGLLIGWVLEYADADCKTETCPKRNPLLILAKR